MDYLKEKEKEFKKSLSRMDNLMFKDKVLNYLYMGSMEDCQHLKTFLTKDGSFVEANMLTKSLDIIPTDVVCEKCDSNVFIRDEDYEWCLSTCREDCELFYEPNNEIIQKVVYYNPKLNSAVVFEMWGDYICEYYGEETVIDLINDIHNSVNSAYNLAEEEESLGVKVLEYFNTNDSVTVISYINGEIMGADIELYRGCLKMVDIENQIDIIQSYKGKKSEFCYHL